ncbi:MAG: hypothetical protein FWC11_04530 [Firmicutes bacterium]|nr:hypothetical protein [Bacillota bacterium]MCL2256108.1 hypothetical protein [Bacillota bacterium]
MRKKKKNLMTNGKVFSTEELKTLFKSDFDTNGSYTGTCSSKYEKVTQDADDL